MANFAKSALQARMRRLAPFVPGRRTAPATRPTPVLRAATPESTSRDRWFPSASSAAAAREKCRSRKQQKLKVEHFAGRCTGNPPGKEATAHTSIAGTPLISRHSAAKIPAWPGPCSDKCVFGPQARTGAGKTQNHGNLIPAQRTPRRCGGEQHIHSTPGLRCRRLRYLYFGGKARSRETGDGQGTDNAAERCEQRHGCVSPPVPAAGFTRAINHHRRSRTTTPLQ